MTHKKPQLIHQTNKQKTLNKQTKTKKNKKQTKEKNQLLQLLVPTQSNAITKGVLRCFLSRQKFFPDRGFIYQKKKKSATASCRRTKLRCYQMFPWAIFAWVWTFINYQWKSDMKLPIITLKQSIRWRVMLQLEKALTVFYAFHANEFWYSQSLWRSGLFTVNICTISHYNIKFLQKVYFAAKVPHMLHVSLFICKGERILVSQLQLKDITG